MITQPISVTRSERLQLSGPSELAFINSNGSAASPGSKPRLMYDDGGVSRLNFTFKAFRIQIRNLGCLHPGLHHLRWLLNPLGSGIYHIEPGLPQVR